MAIGEAGDEQEEVFVTYKQIRSVGGHPSYELLNRVLAKADFDRFVEADCQKFYRICRALTTTTSSSVC